MRVFVALMLIAGAQLAHAQDRIFRCGSEYTNNVSLALAQGCIELKREPVQTTMPQSAQGTGNIWEDTYGPNAAKRPPGGTTVQPSTSSWEQAYGPNAGSTNAPTGSGGAAADAPGWFGISIVLTAVSSGLIAVLLTQRSKLGSGYLPAALSAYAFWILVTGGVFAGARALIAQTPSSGLALALLAGAWAAAAAAVARLVWKAR